nr:hypothetical protein L204_05121 [Cryptococcus depauperatus CBS 7855]
MPLGDYFCEASSRGSWVVPWESKSDLANIPICICVRTWIDSRGSTDGLGTRVTWFYNCRSGPSGTNYIMSEAYTLSCARLPFAYHGPDLFVSRAEDILYALKVV